MLELTIRSGKFNLHLSVPSVWNNLDEKLKSRSSLCLFRKAMIKNYFYLHLITLAWYCQSILSLLLFKTQELINTIPISGAVVKLN